MRLARAFTVKNLFIAFLSLLLLSAITALSVLLFRNGEKTDKKQSLDRYFSVKRGDIVIGVFLSGNVNAKQKHKLALEANFRTTLIWVIAENSIVKAGDELARFNVDDLSQKIEELELTGQNLGNERKIAIEEISIQKSSNEVAIKIATDNLLEAEDAFVKYRKLEGPKDSDTQKVKVEEASKLLEDAKKIYNDALLSFQETVFMEENDRKRDFEKLTTLEKKVLTEEINYNNSILDRKIFKRFTYPNKLTQLSNKVEQEKLNLNKARVTAGSQLLQKENQLAKIEAQINKNLYDLEKHKMYVNKMKLVAPADGIVTYSDPDRRWGGTQEIKVGMDVKPQEVLLTIPEMSSLIVEFDIPEQYRAKVKKGDSVVVKPDSLPGMKITGEISHIAPTPVSQIFWDRNSPKIYPAKVDLAEQPKTIVSGMSVRVEIITDIVKDVLYVPIEAVFDEDGKYFVYLNVDEKSKIVEVEIGASNDYYVEIKKGIQENDVVYLYRPFQK